MLFTLGVVLHCFVFCFFTSVPCLQQDPLFTAMFCVSEAFSLFLVYVTATRAVALRGEGQGNLLCR